MLRDRLAAAAVQLQDRRAVSEPREAQWLVHVSLWHPGGGRRAEQPRRELLSQPHIYAGGDSAIARTPPLGWSDDGRDPAGDAAVGVRSADQPVRPSRH